MVNVPRSALGPALLSIAFLVAPGKAAMLMPLSTEEAHTLPSGEAELVLSTRYFDDLLFPAFTGTSGVRDSQVVLGPELSLHTAAGSWAEIQVRFGSVYLDETQADGTEKDAIGAGDARLFTKVRFLRERAVRPAVGFRFGTKLPNADAGDRLGTDETDFLIDALLSKNLGMVEVHTNLGIHILGNPGPVLGAEDRESTGQDDLFHYTVALVSRPLAAVEEHTVRLMGEIDGLTGSRFDNDRLSLRGGLQWQHRGWRFFLGASTGLVDESEDFGLAGGLGYAFDLDRLVARLDPADTED